MPDNETKPRVEPADGQIPTRQSLLSRLKNWNDHESWQVFFDTYWALIYTAAVRAGLTNTEAQEVVQETFICVAKKMPEFKYDGSKGSFKAWLMRVTSWRIKRQLGRRPRKAGSPAPDRDTATGTRTLERLPDPAGLAAFEDLWDEEWEKNLLAAALERVKRKADPKQYQIFDYYVLKKMPIPQVMQALNVSRARIYLAKHRLGTLMAKELEHLRVAPI